MTQSRRLPLLFLVILLVSASGCLEKHNPEYFPHFGLFNRVVQTHAKPNGLAYFSDFDPHAVKLEVLPLDSSSPVGCDQLVIATVYDDKDKARRNRRIEWLLEGAGEILEVDESGYFPGRGGKLDNTWAYSYTDYIKHRLNRHTGNKDDEFLIHPGQTWCVIRSSTEGVSHLTAYAPEIANWNNNKVTIAHTWVNAAWTFPKSVSAIAGHDCDLVTRLYRPSDHQGLANYSVRYNVLPAAGSPQAVFLPTQGQEAVVSSDLDGNAHAFVTLAAGQTGTTKVAIEVYRTDPAGGPAMFIARGETSVDWDSAKIFLSQTAPPSVTVNQDNSFAITIANNGKLGVKTVTLRQAIPEGLQYVSSQPPATLEGNQLTWAVAPLEPGKTRAIQVVYRPTRLGAINTCVSAETDDGYKGQQCATVNVAAPGLKLTVNAPATGAVGAPINYDINLTNAGSAAANNVVIRSEFDAGLEHESKSNPPLEMNIGTLAAGQSRAITLALTPNRTGKLSNRITASGDGGLIDRTESIVDVQDAKLKVSIDGPKSRYAERPAEWTIHVANTSKMPLANVQLRDVLPAEVSFKQADNGGTFADRQVVWNLGTLQPGQEVQVKLATLCEQPVAHTVNKVIASVDRQLTFEESSPLEVLGVPSFGLKVVDLKDPVEVGGTAAYRVDVANHGSLDGNQVEIRASIPPELQVVSATGPANCTWRRDGQDLVFLPMDGLRPRQTFTYYIQTKAVSPGEAIVQIELKTASLKRPVVAQESTRLYPSRNGFMPPSIGPAVPETPAPPIATTELLPSTPRQYSRISASMPESQDPSKHGD
jgi:uncharacterized repeat protein (TIGR01451 family)